MYLLDTNVVSELRKVSSGKTHANVVLWATSVPASSLYISVITVLEIEIGVLLKERRDKKQGAVLRVWYEQHVLPAFTDRILSLDTTVARQCAQLHVPDPHTDRDAIIAATAIAHGMTVVTRNSHDFDSTGVTILNPWEFIANPANT